MTRTSDSDMPTALGISQTVYLLFPKLWDVTITGGQDDVTYFNGIDFSTYKLSRNTPYQTHSKYVNSAKTCWRFFFSLFLILSHSKKGCNFDLYSALMTIEQRGFFSVPQHPFIMVNSEDPWHQLLSVLHWSLFWHYLF